jgi:hypothetical protein
MKNQIKKKERKETTNERIAKRHEDISQKKMYRWQKKAQKDIQHCQLLGESTLKPQSAISLQNSENG